MYPNETVQKKVVEQVDGRGRLELRRGKDKVLVEHYGSWGVLSSSITVELRELSNAILALVEAEELDVKR